MEYNEIAWRGEQMIKTLKALWLYTHTHTTLTNDKKTLVAFLYPEIKIKTSKVTHAY